MKWIWIKNEKGVNKGLINMEQIYYQIKPWVIIADHCYVSKVSDIYQILRYLKHTCSFIGF